ncbi:MAG: DUF6252 family protein [Candidatus Kapaibacterium sp.]
MRYPVALFLVLFCGMMIAACGSDPASSTNTTPNGSISAKVSGASWAATNVQSTWQSNVLSLGGSQIQGSGNQQINITGLISKTGTYQLNPFAGLNASYTEATTSGGVSAKIFSVTSGTLVVGTLSATGASGTFSFEAKESQGTGTRSITEGKFDVKF